MRLWHKDLIQFLPRQQLLGQWRECCCIASNIYKHGTPNHVLVNKIMDYPISHFYFYCNLVYEEMKKRGYRVNIEKLTKWIGEDYKDYISEVISYKNLFYDWHNDRYLMQCFYNLQEKFDCGGITQEEFELIQQEVSK